jgi:hypothetical protein
VRADKAKINLVHNQISQALNLLEQSQALAVITRIQKLSLAHAPRHALCSSSVSVYFDFNCSDPQHRAARAIDLARNTGRGARG